MSTIYQLLVGIVLGIVQGVSEWLPISSKTQVLVVSTYLLNLTFQQAYAFGLFMEIGTVVAAAIYFRTELLALLSVLLGSKDSAKRKLFVYVLVATIATGIVGAPLYLIADSLTGVPLGIPMLLIGIVLIVDALVIWHSKKKQREGVNTRKFANLGMKDYIIIGIAQGIAALPGVSRSGITTSTLLFMHVEPEEAFRLSFLIGIFAAIAAFGLVLLSSKTNVSVAITSVGFAGIAVAIVTSIIVSLVLIRFLINVAGKSKIVYLTAALGIIAIISGVISIITGVTG